MLLFLALRGDSKKHPATFCYRISERERVTTIAITIWEAIHIRSHEQIYRKVGRAKTKWGSIGKVLKNLAFCTVKINLTANCFERFKHF